MKIGLTATIKSIDAGFDIWCSHHLRFFDYLLIWIDDVATIEEGIPRTDSRVRIFPGSQKEGSSVRSRLMPRQQINTNTALRQCPKLGIEWLCHLDSDELLYARSREELESVVIPGLGHVTFINHEVWPVWEAKDPFVECHAFKLNGRYPFHFYRNGKSMVRCGARVSANGPHSFIGYEGAAAHCNTLPVLHYTCATYRTWLNKYANLGTFNDLWWDNPELPITLDFHLRSRDIYKLCIEQASFTEAEVFFRSLMLSDKLRRDLENQARIGYFYPL